MYVIILNTLMVISLKMMIAFTQEPYENGCKDQQETCECDKNQKECHFRLEIEELQTFASYIVTQQDGEVKTRGIAGDTYYLNGNGFNPTIPPPKRDYVLEYGPCWRESLAAVEDFRSPLDGWCRLCITSS